VFLPRDARNAKCGITIVSRPSIRLSVCDVDVCWIIGWTSSKVIARIISLGSSLLGTTSPAI